jgi:hypothetical protein
LEPEVNVPEDQRLAVDALTGYASARGSIAIEYCKFDCIDNFRQTHLNFSIFLGGSARKIHRA